MRLKERVAIVTGSGRGIGREMAITFAREGARIAVVDIDGDNAAGVAAEIKNSGGQAIAVRTDITQYDQVEAMCTEVINTLGTPSILVNNAVVGRFNNLLNTTQEDWKVSLDVGLTGYFYCSQVVARVMMKGDGGAIINMTSIVWQRANSALVGYTAAKAGVVGLTLSSAVELSPKIRVNAICPGVIETDLSRSLVPGAAAWEERIRRIPMGRLGRPEDVAKVALFLASDDAGYITGHVLNVDGGYTTAGMIIPQASAEH